MLRVLCPSIAFNHCEGATFIEESQGLRDVAKIEPVLLLLCGSKRTSIFKVFPSMRLLTTGSISEYENSEYEMHGRSCSSDYETIYF